MPSHSPHHKDAAVTGNQTGLIMEYPEQTITRLTQRLGRAPTPAEIKAERDMLMRAVYGSMLLAEIIVFNQKIAAVVSGGTFDTYCPMASSQMALM